MNEAIPPELPELPTEAGMTIRTPRLTLVPLVRDHAAILFPILSDGALYTFTGGEPPASEESLRDRFAFLEARRSPDGGELWLNWLIRRLDDDEALGTVQSTVLPTHAYVAWVVGTRRQNLGYASEAAAGLVAWLRTAGIPEIRACVHPDHAASQGVARNAGLIRSDRMEDGEEVWVWR